MKRLQKEPLSILLAIFAAFGMWRSLISILTAVKDEATPWRAALIYLLLIAGMYLGTYLSSQPWPAPGEAPDDQKARAAWTTTLNKKLLGVLILAVALSLVLGAWLVPYMRVDPTPTENISSPTPTAVMHASVTPSPGATNTLSPSHTPTPTRTSTPRPTRKPDGVRMQVVVARVHIRQAPTSQSASRGELNNGDWLYFDAQAYDAQGTLWLRVARGQDDRYFEQWSGLWVYAGAVNEVGLQDLPLLPATATPTG